MHKILFVFKIEKYYSNLNTGTHSFDYLYIRRHKTDGGVDSIVGKCKEAMGEEKKLR